jgi:arginyl-tRNA synthetase
MLDDHKSELTASLAATLADLDLDEVDHDDLIEIKEVSDGPKGEFASAAPYRLASVANEAPDSLAERIADRHRGRGLPDGIDELTVVEGYLNYHVDEIEFATEVIDRVLAEGDTYGHVTREDPETIVADISSPNICKPMHIGHLRNNVLSDSLTAILDARGHEVIRDNHLGDWGTQFGNLIYWFREVGDESKLEEEPIEHLLELYQGFSQREAELDNADDEAALEDLRDHGREWFARVENEDPEAFELWQRFWDASVARFKETYELLDMEFDEWLGESFYALNGWNDRVIDRALTSEAAIETGDGLVYIPVYPTDTDEVEEPETASVSTNLTPAREALESETEAAPDDSDEEDDTPEVSKSIIRKSDGSTTYATRDLAAVEYRAEEFDADRCLYVVASEQDEYFQEMFAAARKLGHTDMAFTHVSYGMISLPGGSMSTRHGRIIRAREVIQQATDRAADVLDEKNPGLDEDEQQAIAETIGIGTVKFENIATGRTKDITFDLEEAISFEGDTGPYVQYSDTRARSIVEDVDLPGRESVSFDGINESDFAMIHTLAKFPRVLAKCESVYDAAPLANYLLQLAHEFNSFYHTNRVLDAEDLREGRLLITQATHQVFENGLELLGIETLNQM